MASSFPGAIDSFTTKVDGVDDVMAAHVNDLQDSVVAIETMLDKTKWQDWTPVWTAATTNPSIGDGTLVGKYCVIGNTVHLIIGLVCGSTTTFGSGAWSFSLPFPVKAQTDINQTFIGQVIARDASPAENYLHFCRVTRYAKVINAFFNVSSSSTIITDTSPFTWAESDQLFLQLTYEK